MIKLVNFLIINLFLVHPVVNSFRIQYNNGISASAHSVTPYQHRQNALSLLGPKCTYFSRCNFLNRLCTNISNVVNHVNEVVPGGILTAIVVPIATTAIIRRYLGRSEDDKTSANLHRYQCMGCGFIIFPAKNREDRFFSTNFTCPNCGAPKSRFVEKYKG